MDIKDRIKEYIALKRITVAEFERNTSLSNGYIKNLKSSIGADKLNEIISAYSDLNLEWLVTGNGDMIKSDSSGIPLSDQKETEYKNTIRELEAEINQLKGENRILREQVGLGERKVNNNKSA